MIINKQRVFCFFALHLLKRNFKWTIDDNQFILLIYLLINYNFFKIKKLFIYCRIQTTANFIIILLFWLSSADFATTSKTKQMLFIWYIYCLFSFFNLFSWHYIVVNVWRRRNVVQKIYVNVNNIIFINFTFVIK